MSTGSTLTDILEHQGEVTEGQRGRGGKEGKEGGRRKRHTHTHIHTHAHCPEHCLLCSIKVRAPPLSGALPRAVLQWLGVSVGSRVAHHRGHGRLVWTQKGLGHLQRVPDTGEK